MFWNWFWEKNLWFFIWFQMKMANMSAVFSSVLAEFHTLKVYNININPMVKSARLYSWFESSSEVNAACTCFSVFCTALYERASVHAKLWSVNCEFSFCEHDASAKHWQKDFLNCQANLTLGEKVAFLIRFQSNSTYKAHVCRPAGPKYQCPAFK